MLDASRKHLADVGETYFEHMRFALLVGALGVGAGMACIIHAFLPALCERSCSRAVGALQRLFADRSLLGEVVAENSALLTFVALAAISTITCLVLAICTAGTWLPLILLPQALTLPLVYLAQNRGLDPESA